MYIDVDFEDKEIKILRKEFDIKISDFYNIIYNLCDDNKNFNKNIFYIDFLPERILNNEKYSELEEYILNNLSENTNIYSIYADDMFANKIINLALNLIAYFPNIVFLEKNKIISNYEIKLNKKGFFKLADLIKYIVKFDIGKLKILFKCNNNLYLLFSIDGGYNISIYFSDKNKQNSDFNLLRQLVLKENLFLKDVFIK